MQFSKRTVEYEVGSLSKIFIALLSAINLANLVLLYLGISKHIVAPFNGEPTLVGLARWGRFYGFFYDPNYASIVCICAILLSIHFLCRAKKTFSKILYIFAIILQLAYILAGQSRTGYIALAVSLLLYIILYFSHAKPPRFTRQKLLSIFFSTLLISVSAFSLVKAPEFLNKVNTKASTDSSSTSSVRDTESTIESSDDKTTSENTKVSEKVKKLTITLARTDNSSDISNRRFDIWKSGLEILQHSNPLIGIGHSNYIGFAEANLPETYIVSNSFQKFDAFHNSLIDLIVSQGILGFLIVATIVVYLAYLVIKNSAVFAQSPITISLLSSLVAICVSSMFVSEIFYINNCCTFLFWVFLGYYYYFLQTANQQRRLKHVKH